MLYILAAMKFFIFAFLSVFIQSSFCQESEPTKEKSKLKYSVSRLEKSELQKIKIALPSSDSLLVFLSEFKDCDQEFDINLEIKQQKIWLEEKRFFYQATFYFGGVKNAQVPEKLYICLLVKDKIVSHPVIAHFFESD